MKNDILCSQALLAFEKHTVRRTNSSDVVGYHRNAKEQMRTIDRIFKDSLYGTKTDVFMLNVFILQSRLSSSHNPNICGYIVCAKIVKSGDL